MVARTAWRLTQGALPVPPSGSGGGLAASPAADLRCRVGERPDDGEPEPCIQPASRVETSPWRSTASLPSEDDVACTEELAREALLDLAIDPFYLHRVRDKRILASIDVVVVS